MPHRGQGLYQFCYRQDRFSFQRKIAMNKESEYEFIAFPKLNHVKVGFVDIDFRRPHIHREMEIGLVLSGNANLIVNGQRYSIQQGSIFFINANEMHNVACQGQGSVRIVYIQVSNRFCQEYLHLFRNLEILQSDLTENITARDNCVLTRLIIETCRCYLDDSELSLLHCMETLCGLFCHLLSIIPYRHFDEADYQARKHKSARIQRITEYINMHYSEKISLSALAEMENISTTHLSHFISDNLNMTFQDYVNNLRLEKAVHLIVNTNLRMTDICLECGFSDIKYLNKVFARQFNCLPKDYRSEHMTDRVQKSNDAESQIYASERVGRVWIEGFLNAFEAGSDMG